MTYRFDIFSTWKIHSIVFVVHLKSVSNENDFYQREIAEPDSIKMEKKNSFDLYEVEKIIVKKIVRTDRGRNRRFHSEFRVKWSKWEDQHNKWMKKNQLDECAKLLVEFENTEKFSNIEWNSRLVVLNALIHYNIHIFGSVHLTFLKIISFSFDLERFQHRVHHYRIFFSLFNI